MTMPRKVCLRTTGKARSGAWGNPELGHALFTKAQFAKVALCLGADELKQKYAFLGADLKPVVLKHTHQSSDLVEAVLQGGLSGNTPLTNNIISEDGEYLGRVETECFEQAVVDKRGGSCP